MIDYGWTLLALLAALLVYVCAAIRVGRARGAYGVKAPATSGPAAFECVYRAHQNTVEQMVLFLPLLAVTAVVWGDRWAALYGAVWAVGRLLYIEGYARAPEKRELGFMLSGVLSLLVLVALTGTLLWRLLGS